MKYQGYFLTRIVSYQDNGSAIKLEKNETKSAGDRSRHVNIRYYFVKDIIQCEKIEVQHCPTEIMISDFLTKPLQGGLFKRLRDTIMGLILFQAEEHVDNIESWGKLAPGNQIDGRGIETKSTGGSDPKETDPASRAVDIVIKTKGTRENDHEERDLANGGS